MKTRLVKAIDFAALFVGIVGLGITVIVLVVLGIMDVIREVSREMDGIMNRGDDRVIFLIFICSVAWCALRWKKMDKRGF